MQVKVPMGWFDSVVEVYNEDMINGYWDKTGKYPILLLVFPFWLVLMLVYVVYLIFYGLMKLLVFIQEGGITEPIFNMQNGFGKVILIIIVLPIAIVLWILSTLFPLCLTIVLFVLGAVLSLFALPAFSRRKKMEEEEITAEYLEYVALLQERINREQK
ncbi:MAG: hypothetical protein E7353_02415 [Clostridiales bacterium]|nr:hypothetical protein [Clostridiales bacterium]